MADIKEVISKCTSYKKGKPLSSFNMTYDAPSNQLEPIYYWLLDFMQDAGIGVEKITDNFMASPGSGQFGEMGQKATAMQQQASKLLADTNTLVKTVLNLVYDLKEFEIRLKHYERAKSKNNSEVEEGMLALKNIWLDQVDIKRGRGSVHQLTYEMGFTTLREAFMKANTTQEVKDMASKEGVINDSVMRILIPRISEFLTWKEMSEKELEKRFSIEKSYLKSEVEALKLYTQWARPYLKAASDLRMKGFDKNPALVAAFSTSMFELTLMGKRKTKAPPAPHQDYKLERDYFAIYVISLKFRGHLGQKAGQGAQSGYAYAFGGRVDMTFDCYCLNSEELKLVQEEMKKADLDDGLKLVEDNTQTALDQLKDDIIKYTGDDPLKKKEEKKEEKISDVNPFTALFSGFSDFFKPFEFKKEKKEIKELKDVKKDTYVEEIVRDETGKGAKEMLFAIYDVYKKAHGMASSPDKFDN